MNTKEALRLVAFGSDLFANARGREALDRLEEALDRLEADARALWAVRVLDAHGDYRVTTSEPVLVRVFRGGEKTLRFRGADEDAARLAAAHAVFPSLDETTRAKLGECP